MSDFDPKPKYKKGDRVKVRGRIGTIASGPRWDPEGDNLCWFCHEQTCAGDCNGELFGDHCESPADCHLCGWAELFHQYIPTRMQ